MSRRRNHDNDAEFVWMKCGDKPIKLNLNGATSYYRTSNYKANLLNISFTWHMIDVHHRNAYRKDDILEALFNVVGNEEFYPVGYKEGNNVDTFLVRNCKGAIQKLFYSGLVLTMKDRNSVFLTVSLNAAEHVTGQIFPTKVLEKIVEKQFKHLGNTDIFSNVLLLENLSTQPEMADIVINLSSGPAFQLLCKVIAQNHNILNTINGINLSKNGILDPSPLKEFVHSSIKMIDLRHNNIQLCNQFHELKCLNIDELYVQGNPCTTEASYLDEIKKLLPTLKKLDGIKTEQIKEISTDTVEMTYPGTIIQDARDRINFTMYRNSSMWSQVVIEHKGQAKKRDILKAIFDVVEGALFPCYYKSSRIEDTFFVRNAYEQLETFLDIGMALRIPNCNEILITLKMNVADFKKGHVEPHDAIVAAMATRFNVMNKCLNLNGFQACPELKNVIIYLASQHILTTVVTMACRRFLVNLEELRLGKNRISSVKALRSLNNAKSVKILSLRDNMIEDLNDFAGVIKIPITELTLDGNPLCKNYTSGKEYMRQVKKLFPDLIKLDGFPVTKQSSMLPFEKNYLCSMEAYGFVDQFVNHFFPVFDSPQRLELLEMYDKNAMASVSFYYDPSRITEFIASRLKKYELLSRNLISDLPYPIPDIQYKRDRIADLFQYYPETEHDLYSFTTDVSLFTDNLVCLTITGVFQEPATITDFELRLAFSRTFLLKQHATELGIFKFTSEYKIINDIINIINPSDEQYQTAFRYAKPKKPQKAQNLSSEEKENFMTMFQKMTGLKSIWVSKCLEEGNWDYKRALEVFLRMEKDNRIPDSAFNQI